MKLIHKSPYWWVQIATESGETREVNTWATTRREAEALVRKSRLKELEAAGKAHGLTAEAVALITTSRTTTVNEAIEMLDEWGNVGFRSNRTRINTIWSLRRWADVMRIGDKSLARVTEDDIYKFVNSGAAGWKASTRKVHLAAIRALMRFALVKRMLLQDPSALVAVDQRRLSHEQREATHKKVLGDTEVEFALNKCTRVWDNPEYCVEPPALSPGFFHAAIILGRDLGLRLGDIVSLEISQFNFARQTVVVWQGKTNNRIELPLSDRVLELLAEMPQRHPKYLFPKEREIYREPNRRALLSVYFSRFMQRIGFKGVSFHSLRASYSTALAARGATMEEIAEALGHKSKNVARVYVRDERLAVVNKR